MTDPTPWDIFDRIVKRTCEAPEFTASDNLNVTDHTVYRAKMTEVSDEFFGIGYDIEEAKKQILADCIALAPYMNGPEVIKFLNEIGLSMKVAKRGQ
jgi:hypothetical protein